jgi:hypothetical protein
MRFKSEKGVLFGLVCLAFMVFMISISTIKITYDGFESYDLIILAPVFLLAWFWFGTNYTIDAEYIRYKSGFIFGKISILEIRKIEMNKTLWIGLRPALAKNGLIIKYGKYDEIYFSPVDKEKFVGLLQEINPSIIVKDANINS